MSDAVARVGLTAAPIGMTDRTVAGIREVLGGGSRWRSPLLIAGPAGVASIAHMGPAISPTTSRLRRERSSIFVKPLRLVRAAARDGGLNFED